MSMQSSSVSLRSMKRGTGCSSGRMVAWLSVEKVSKPDRDRSTLPSRRRATRSSLETRTSFKAEDEVGERRDSKGMWTIGSSSEAGDLGEWKVALFFRPRSRSVVDRREVA